MNLLLNKIVTKQSPLTKEILILQSQKGQEEYLLKIEV
jgi:hypothetical protein